MLKQLKKIICISLFIFLMIYLAMGYFNSTYYKQKKYLNIDGKMKGKILFKYDSSASFLGDGLTLITYKLKIKDIIEAENHKQWIEYEYNFNEFLNMKSYSNLINFEVPVKGYYLLYDKHAKRLKEFQEYINEKEYRSYNYILAIIDFDKEILYYIEEDT